MSITSDEEIEQIFENYAQSKSIFIRHPNELTKRLCIQSLNDYYNHLKRRLPLQNSSLEEWVDINNEQYEELEEIEYIWRNTDFAAVAAREAEEDLGGDVYFNGQWAIPFLNSDSVIRNNWTDSSQGETNFTIHLRRNSSHEIVFADWNFSEWMSQRS